MPTSTIIDVIEDEVTNKLLVVDEGEHNPLSVTLVDSNGTGVTPLTIVLDLFDDSATPKFINGRQEQDVLDANGGALTGSVLIMTLSPLDNVIVDATLAPKAQEPHIAVFTYTFTSASGTQTGIAKARFYVQKKQSPTAP